MSYTAVSVDRRHLVNGARIKDSDPAEATGRIYTWMDEQGRHLELLLLQHYYHY